MSATVHVLRECTPWCTERHTPEELEAMGARVCEAFIPVDGLRVRVGIYAVDRGPTKLGHLQGLRAFEIAKVRGEDVTAERLEVVGKGGVVATVPTHPHMWEIAQDYPRSGYWFPSVRHDHDHVTRQTASRHVGQHFRSVGIMTGSIHRMRHT